MCAYAAPPGVDYKLGMPAARLLTTVASPTTAPPSHSLAEVRQGSQLTATEPTSPLRHRSTNVGTPRAVRRTGSLEHFWPAVPGGGLVTTAGRWRTRRAFSCADGRRDRACYADGCGCPCGFGRRAVPIQPRGDCPPAARCRRYPSTIFRAIPRPSSSSPSVASRNCLGCRPR